MVQADNVVVSGRIEGSISARRLEIIAGGTVEGDVHIVDLVIEPGGRFNGSSKILVEQAEQAPGREAGRRDARRTGAAQESEAESAPAA